MTAPLIGVTGRRLSGRSVLRLEPRYQAREVDLYFADYSRALARAGGAPVHLSYDSGVAAVSRLDALLLTGGEDVSADHGGASDGGSHPVNPSRDAAEIELAEAAMERGIPVLGVCRGLQLLNVMGGGTLIPDLPVQDRDHQQKGYEVDEETHRVEFLPGSVLQGVYGSQASVNSLHHQAVDTIADGYTVSSVSIEDGVIEGIEHVDRPVLAVQWHPEWRRDDPIFGWLVDAARRPR